MPIEPNANPSIYVPHFTLTPVASFNESEWIAFKKTRRPVVPDGASFIEQYVIYADRFEIPAKMHEATAIQLIASILNKNGVGIVGADGIIPLDLWMLLLSESGGGRSTLIRVPTPIVKLAKIDIIRKEDWGSPQACQERFAAHSNGLYVWGELSEKLKKMKQPNFSHLTPWITDRYDNPDLPDPIVYRTGRGPKSDTQPITFLRAPRINLLATSSEAWFFKNIDIDDSAGGFIPRWTILRTTEMKEPVPKVPPPDKLLESQLAEDLRHIDMLRGNANLEEIEHLHEKWYRATQKRFHGYGKLGGSFFARHRAHILKLAVIYEAASSFSLEVTQASWEKAEATARDLERTIFGLLDIGLNGRGYELKEAEDFFREAGAEGRSRSEYTVKFKNTDKRVRDERLATLLEQGTIHSVKRTTKGRTADVFVHRDFCPE
jgi:hypothetical protein